MNRRGIVRDDGVWGVLRRAARLLARAWAEPLPPLVTMLGGVAREYARPRQGLWGGEPIRRGARLGRPGPGAP